MYEFASALFLSIGIYAYWFACRKSSLVKRRVASQAVVDLVARHDVSDQKKHKAAWFFEMMTRWYSLPAITFLGFPVVIYGIFTNRSGSAARSARPDDDAMNASWQMYVRRNPLTTMICLTFMSLVITLITPVAVACNKFRSIPSMSEVISSAVESGARHREDPQTR